MDDLDPYLIHGSLDPDKSARKTASRSVQLFCIGLDQLWAQGPQAHSRTDHATCDICSNSPHLCTV